MAKALVAKSYEKLEQVCEPYMLNGREYVKVRLASGAIKQVRSYSEKEYAKFYPEVKIINPGKSKREIFGFGDAGFIWIFSGNTYENLEWFKASPMKYCRTWGWYLPSSEEIPEPLPANVTPIKLPWDMVKKDETSLLDEAELKTIADSLIYPIDENGEFVGEIGDRITFNATLDRAIPLENYYGHSFMYIFNDTDGHIYVWTTAAAVLTEGETYGITGTVKDHKIYRGQYQTILTRCKIAHE